MTNSKHGNKKDTWNVEDAVIEILYLNSACDYDACETLAGKVFKALALPESVQQAPHKQYLKTKKALTELMGNKT